MKYPIKILHLGTDTIELHWPEIIAEDLLIEIITLKNRIQEKWHIIISSIYHSYQILSIRLKYIANSSAFNAWLKELIKGPLPKMDLPQRWVWTIPVCYDLEIVPSLSKYLEEKSMDVQTLIDRHTSHQYLLYFYGFLPGFMYLGGLPSILHIPRKSIPDKKIEKGIYPADSPGGWYIVGKMPVTIFDKGQLNLPFNPGDKIQFKAISPQEYFEIREESDYKWAKTLYRG